MFLGQGAFPCAAAPVAEDQEPSVKRGLCFKTTTSANPANQPTNRKFIPPPPAPRAQSPHTPCPETRPKAPTLRAGARCAFGAHLPEGKLRAGMLCRRKDRLETVSRCPVVSNSKAALLKWDNPRIIHLDVLGLMGRAHTVDGCSFHCK